jgi:hypothetical protein
VKETLQARGVRLVRFVRSSALVAVGLVSVAGGIVAADRGPKREASPVVLRTVPVVDGDGFLEAIDFVIEAGWPRGPYAQLGMSFPTGDGPRASSVFFRARVGWGSHCVDVMHAPFARVLATMCVAATDRP